MRRWHTDIKGKQALRQREDHEQRHRGMKRSGVFREKVEPAGA